MFKFENEAIEKVREVVLGIVPNDRLYEIFIDGCESVRAGEYIITIVVRVHPGNAEVLTKEFCKLFIEGSEIVFKRRYTATVSPQGLRVEDFVLEATISLLG